VTSSNQNGFLNRLSLGLKSQVEKVVVNILGVLRRVNPKSIELARAYEHI
jgi:hypothetical protein